MPPIFNNKIKSIMAGPKRGVPATKGKKYDKKPSYQHYVTTKDGELTYADGSAQRPALLPKGTKKKPTFQHYETTKDGEYLYQDGSAQRPALRKKRQGTKKKAVMRKSSPANYDILYRRY